MRQGFFMWKKARKLPKFFDFFYYAANAYVVQYMYWNVYHDQLHKGDVYP